MKVWAVHEAMRYEYDEVFAIFDTEEAADACIKRQPKRLDTLYRSEEFELNQEQRR